MCWFIFPHLSASRTVLFQNGLIAYQDRKVAEQMKWRIPYIKKLAHKRKLIWTTRFFSHCALSKISKKCEDTSLPGAPRYPERPAHGSGSRARAFQGLGFRV